MDSLMLLINILLFNTFYSALQVIITKTNDICDTPFVQIGKNCYFFTAYNVSEEYYVINYKNHYYSVPTKNDWIHTYFACETLDPDAHPISIETANEMEDIEKFMTFQNFPLIYTFWSSGHGSSWFHSAEIINYTKWSWGETNEFHMPKGECMNLRFSFGDLLISNTDCFTKLPYACELDMD